MNPLIKVAQIRWGEPIGGVERVLRDLAFYGDKNTFTYKFIFLSCGGQFESEMRESGHSIVVIPARNGYDISMRIALIKELLKFSPDCINEHGIPPLIRPLIKISVKVPLVTFEHGDIQVNIHKGKGWINHLHGFEIRHFSDVIIVNSNTNKNLVASTYRISKDRIKTILLGIDLRNFSLNQSKPLNDTIVLGYVGRIHNFDKGTDYLPLLALELVKRGYIKFCFKIIGDGPDRPFIEAQADRIGVKKHFEFLGKRQDIPDLLSGIDILIIPSRTEAFGLVAVEALAAGTRVIAFATGALPEILSDCKDATLVPAGNIAAMAEAVIKSWGIKGKERATDGQNYVRKRFDVRRMINEIETTYKNAVFAYKNLNSQTP
jgi:glycosyltransferase involved in cell wall biosynthesis